MENSFNEKIEEAVSHDIIKEDSEKQNEINSGKPETTSRPTNSNKPDEQNSSSSTPTFEEGEEAQINTSSDSASTNEDNFAYGFSPSSYKSSDKESSLNEKTTDISID